MSWLQPEDFRLEAGHQMMGNLHTSLNPCRNKVSVLAPTANVKMDGGLARHQWPAGCDCFERQSAISPHRGFHIHSEKPQAGITLHHEAKQPGSLRYLILSRNIPYPTPAGSALRAD